MNFLKLNNVNHFILVENFVYNVDNYCENVFYLIILRWNVKSVQNVTNYITKYD